MRNKAIIIFAIFSLFVFSFFTGCDNGSTSAIPIDPPYENIPALDNYDAVFAGEVHDNRENYEVYPKLMKYYYSLGVRDFVFEGGCGYASLLQYYIDTGNEECLEVIFRNLKGNAACNQETYNFYKELYRWNSTLTQKIKVHGFDVEHDYNRTGLAAIWLILKKYPQIEGVPYINNNPGTIIGFVNDFKANRGRYSVLSSEDMKLYERIVTSIEQGINYYATQQDDGLRENYLIANFRQILNDTRGKKIFAMMGSYHASLTVTNGFSMASVLKNEKRIASIVLRQQANPDRWQYTIIINENLKTTPYNPTYTGNWPWSDGNW